MKGIISLNVMCKFMSNCFNFSYLTILISDMYPNRIIIMWQYNDRHYATKYVRNIINEIIRVGTLKDGVY